MAANLVEDQHHEYVEGDTADRVYYFPIIGEELERAYKLLPLESDGSNLFAAGFMTAADASFVSDAARLGRLPFDMSMSILNTAWTNGLILKV